MAENNAFVKSGCNMALLNKGMNQGPVTCAVRKDPGTGAIEAQAYLKSNMNEIIRKYFSDLPTPDRYVEKNQFSSPADIKMIRQVEEALSVRFPEDYVAFLLATNGYTGIVGQSYCRFLPIEQVVEYTEGYGGEFFPWVVFIGTDDGNEMYVLDKRAETPQFGLLPYIGEETDFIALGPTFEAFIAHLYMNDFWRPANGT